MSWQETLCDNYMTRKTRKQKTQFLEFLQTFCSQQGWDCSIQRAGSVRNFIIGNPAEANVIFTAHYDTPIRRLIPSVIYPTSRFHTLWAAGWPILALLFGFVLLSYLLEYSLFQLMLRIAYFLVILFLCLRLCFGPANYENWNKNTSGIAVLLKLMQTISHNNRHKVAFVFFDDGAAGQNGSRKFKWLSGKVCKEKWIVNLDSVGVGSEFLLFPSTAASGSALANNLLSCIKRQAAKENKHASLITKHRNSWRADHRHFFLAVGICAVTPIGGMSQGIQKIGSPHDDHWEEENLSILVKSLRAFVEQI